MPIPHVSVVMSCFNDARFVDAAVQSIRRQTLTDWELIVMDDGSTDGTGHALDQLAADDTRIRVIHQANTGLTRALIRGCELAKADFIARQDADDASAPRRLELQSQLLRHDESLGFVSCFANYVGPKGEFLSQVTRSTDPRKATRELLEQRLGPPAHGTVMFRKSLYKSIGGYRSQFYYAQDADLWLRMAEHSSIGYVPEPLYDFRFHPASITGSSRDTQAKLGVLGQQCRTARQNGHDESELLQQAESLSNQILEQRRRLADRNDVSDREHNQTSIDYLIGSQLVRNKDLRARTYLTSVLKKKPTHLRAWIRLMQSLVLRSNSLKQTQRGE